MLLSFIICLWSPADAQVNRPGATNLICYNASNNDAQMVITTQGPGPNVEDACPTSISVLRAIDISASNANVPITPINASQGWCVIKRGHKIQIVNVSINTYTHAVSSCLQATNVCFNAVWGCPGIQYPAPWTGKLQIDPNGSCAVEPTLNMPGTINGKYTAGNALAEVVDLSCLKGANATLAVTFTPPAGGPYWFTQLGVNTGAQQPNTTFTTPYTIRNSWVDITKGCDNNCVDPATGLARPGVFPYGCTQCNLYPDPATRIVGQECAIAAQFCAARNNLPPVSNVQGTGCQLTRDPVVSKSATYNPIFNWGGTVLITFMGPLSPPGTCK